MPSSTRPRSPEPNSIHQASKHPMSDAESGPHDPKKARGNSSGESSTRRDSNRDAKRRKRRKRKTPVIDTGAAKSESAHGRLEDRLRMPLSARNDIGFILGPPEADPPASTGSPVEKPTSRSGSCSLHDMDGHGDDATPSAPVFTTSHSSVAFEQSDRKQADARVSEPSLEHTVAQLEAQLKSRDDLISSHQALLNQVQQAATCQICLDLMYKPYALAPCGHLACHGCLVSWFTAPPPDNRHTPPPIVRRKTCPHCRAVVCARPVEVWGVKNIAQAVGKSGLLPNQPPVPLETPENVDANTDPWKDIFPKPGAASHRRFPWYFPGADIGNDAYIADIAPRGEDVGMLDMEDGGIYRCLDCMHEIWDGVCSSCGRVYPGHRPEEDDEDEGDPVGWLEDQMGAEEVDVADDPGWMGLEDGEADDGGDVDNWHPHDWHSPPWRREFMFERRWGFLGTVHIEGEDEEEEDAEGRIVRVIDEDAESGDEGYESSFIDDNDEVVDGPRIYEIGADDEEEHRVDQRARIVELISDNHEEDGYEESEADVGPSAWRWSGRRRRDIVESDGSDGF